MSYELVAELSESEWDKCVATLGSLSGALGDRADSKGGPALYTIKSEEEAAAIIGKTHGKDFLVEYCRGLELARNKNPQSTEDDLSKVGVLADAQAFTKDQKELRAADERGRDISNRAMLSIAGEALKPNSMQKSNEIAEEEAEKKRIIYQTEYELDELNLNAAKSSSVGIDDMMTSILETSKKIESASKDLIDDIQRNRAREAPKPQPTPDAQLKIQASIKREKALKLYESTEGKTLIRSAQQKIAWVSARAAGRTRPDEADRQLAQETIQKLKDSHAYGRGRFASEIILTKARSEARELKLNEEFKKKKPSEVFNFKGMNKRSARSTTALYGKQQDDIVKEALEKERLKRQKEKDKNKDKKY